MLTNDEKVFVAFNWGQFHKMFKMFILDISLNIVIVRLWLYHPGVMR